MGSTIIATQQREYQNVALTAIPASFTTGAGISTASTTKPTARVVYDASSNNEMTSLIKFVPYISVNNATSVGLRFLGWNGYVNTDGTTLWVPTVIGRFDLEYTSGSVPSVTINGATRFLFARITNTSNNGIPTASVNLYGAFSAATANVEPCAAVLDVVGSQIVTVQMQAATGTPDAGILWSPI